jgi:(p)ppGpp synthase/HD superfamily hydrolase
MMRQYELVERVKAYDADAREALLNKAYVYATQKHGSQKRANGDPYFSHPIEVAGILTNYKLDRRHRRHTRRNQQAVRAQNFKAGGWRYQVNPD